jgi:hypothetical protein
MSKGYTGASKKDRGFNQWERDLRDLKKSGEYYNGSATPTTIAEQIEHNKFLETFPGKYPNYGLWESDLILELSKIRINYSLLIEGGVYPKTFKEDGFNKSIFPKEFAIDLKKRSGF